MSDDRTKHFPHMTLREPVKKETLEGRESIEEFLARGGSVRVIPAGQQTNLEGGKETITSIRNRYREKNFKKLETDT